MKKTVLAIATSAMLAATLGLAACGGSSSDSAASPAASESSESEASSSADASESSESADSSSAAKSDLEVSAFAGTTDDGKYIVQYVEMDDSTTQISLATLLFEDINTGECKQYTGEVSIDDDGAIVIDSADDEKIHFMMSASEDSDTIDVVFENYGTAKVAPGDPDAIRDGIDEAMDKAAAAE